MTKLSPGALLQPRSLSGLLGRALLLLVLPYCYLMLCGLVFDYLLKWYFMTGFIFWSLIALYILAAAAIVWMSVRYFKKKKGGA